MSDNDWYLVEIYCDGGQSEESRHSDMPVSVYRRFNDADGRTWGPQYSTGPGFPVDNRRQWLDADGNLRTPMETLGATDFRATETFICPSPVCGFTIRRRWENVETLLNSIEDAEKLLSATSKPLPPRRVSLRRWASRIHNR